MLQWHGSMLLLRSQLHMQCRSNTPHFFLSLAMLQGDGPALFVHALLHMQMRSQIRHNSSYPFSPLGIKPIMPSQSNPYRLSLVSAHVQLVAPPVP